MPIIEVLSVPLMPGATADLKDATNPAGEALRTCFGTLDSLDSVLDFRFGVQIENKNVLIAVVEWANDSALKTFQQSEIFPPFLATLKTIISGPPSLRLYDVTGPIKDAISAPITEIATFYFDQSPPENWGQQAQEFGRLGSGATGLHGFTSGVGLLEADVDGIKGKPAALIVGWESVMSHTNFCGTEAFKTNAPKIVGGAAKRDMAHVALTRYEK